MKSRHVSPYSFQEKVMRTVWSLTEGTLFRLSWPTWYRYRAALLRLFGAHVDGSARVRRLVTTTCPWNLTLGGNTSVGDHARLYCLGPVTIGARVTISQHAHVCAGSHDHTSRDMPLLRPPICIEDDAWIAADAFVGPGVSVGEGALLGARGCCYEDLRPWTIYGGNPATEIGNRTQGRPPINSSKAI